MSLDFASEVDRKFVADNLLVHEDWEADIGGLEHDLYGLLDIESNLGADDLIQQIPNDLETECSLPESIPDDFRPMLDDFQLPMLEDHGLRAEDFACSLPGDLVSSEALMDIASDSSDSGIESVAIKEEPLSPALSHNSECSNDSIMGQASLEHVSWASLSGRLCSTDVKLENPPSPQTCLLTSSPASPREKPLILPVGVTLPASPTPGTMCKTSLVNGNTVTVLTASAPGSPIAGTQVPIQPKPVAPIKPKSVLAPQSPTKPLVLTADEFARLTAQGVLKFHPPAQESSKATVNVAHLIGSQTGNSVTATPTTTILQTPSLPHADGDVRAIKRQQRMIKNRESACLSRKRKKEYLSTLEVRLKECANENEKLKQENLTLKRKINQLQSENTNLKVSSPVKKICLLAVVFFMCLNLSPFSLIQDREGPIQSSYLPEGHISRSLKSITNDDEPEPALTRTTYNSNMVEEVPETIQQMLKQNFPSGTPASLARELLWRKSIDGLNIPISMCPSYFNSTESLRLMNELTGWVRGHQNELELKREQSRKTEQQRRKRTKKQYKPPRRLKAAMKPNLKNLQYNVPDSPYEVQVFTGTEQNYHDFLDSIHRRNDTFYVVSFRRDHLLLPATAHNKTMRPRMSLVMPAVTLNESMQPPSGRIAMMQIDCEVMATKLVHVDKSAIPPSAGEFNASTPEPAPTPTPAPNNGEKRNWKHYPRKPSGNHRN